MDNQEAIEVIKLALSQVEWDYHMDFATAFDMAISALQAQDDPDTNVGDMVSRQKAIDALKGLPTWWADEGGFYGGAQPPMTALLDPEDAVSAIANLPSAQPGIIRCEECANHGKEICYFWSCFYGIIKTPDDGFCHKAERRTDEQTVSE